MSIFESEWINRKDEIKSYLKDLFNNVENSLSFSDDKMSNNYPSPNHYKEYSDYIEESYTFNNNIVYTCGYSIC